MRKVLQLNTCSTCQKILKEWNLDDSFEIQNIKEKNILPHELDSLKELAGSYESLFSRRAQKYRELGLHEKQLTELDYRELILKEYTFLKRPILIIDNEIFVGNGKKSVIAAAQKLRKL